MEMGDNGARKYVMSGEKREILSNEKENELMRCTWEERGRREIASRGRRREMEGEPVSHLQQAEWASGGFSLFIPSLPKPGTVSPPWPCG